MKGQGQKIQKFIFVSFTLKKLQILSKFFPKFSREVRNFRWTSLFKNTSNEFIWAKAVGFLTYKDSPAAEPAQWLLGAGKRERTCSSAFHSSSILQEPWGPINFKGWKTPSVELLPSPPLHISFSEKEKKLQGVCQTHWDLISVEFKTKGQKLSIC